eukprot:scaffold3700_cov387-Prasinococcus_capsulatus_cf.AAC.15
MSPYNMKLAKLPSTRLPLKRRPIPPFVAHILATEGELRSNRPRCSGAPRSQYRRSAGYPGSYARRHGKQS